MRAIWRQYRDLWEEDITEAVFVTFMSILSLAVLMLVVALLLAVATSGDCADCAAVTPR